MAGAILCAMSALAAAPGAAVAAPQIRGTPAGGSPVLVPLHRQRLFIQGTQQTVNAYFGTIFVGGPEPQAFSVVFDTGSGHVILPSSSCTEPACLIHRRYNGSLSAIGQEIDADGSAVGPGQSRDQVSIEFGTGKVTGEFAQETVCIGPGSVEIGADGRPAGHGRCAEVSIVLAVKMTTDPFKFFGFDGVFGLGLDGLALSRNFSFLSSLAEASEAPGGNAAMLPQFGVFLSDHDDLEGSELAMGGYNAKRLRAPLSWVPVEMPELGYWQVKIKSVRVGGNELDMCKSGDCRGVVDTGTSLIGVPSIHHTVLDRELSTPLRETPGITDCRQARLPSLHIELEDFTMTLEPEEYMQDVAGGKASADDRPCKPKLMPLNLQEPLGTNLFILGEPVMHTYYTVFDRQALRIGFGAAARRGQDEAEASHRLRGSDAAARASGDGGEEPMVVLFQVQLRFKRLKPAA